MLIIEVARIELTGNKQKRTAKILVHMLIIEIAKIKFTGGHIGFMLMIEITKFGINWRPYWIILNIHIV